MKSRISGRSNKFLKKFLFSRVSVLLLCGIALGFSVSAATAQVKPGNNAELKKLKFLAGTWKGTGWILTREGRQNSEVTETMQFKLGGQIAVVEGRGISRDEKGVEKPTHQAFGVFSFDRSSGKIKLRFYKAETGEEGETLIEPVGKSISWGFDIPSSGSKVRFVQKISDQGKWVETGEVSNDGGKTWIKFMEMELTKVS